MENKYTSLQQIPPDIGEPEEPLPEAMVPAGIMFFRSSADTSFFGGFDGSRDKTGIMLVRVRPSEPEDPEKKDKKKEKSFKDEYRNFARSFVEFHHGWVENGRVVKLPSLTTSAFFMLKTKCECRDERGNISERTLKPADVFEVGRHAGIHGKSAVDILNRMRCCPFCGKGQLTDWYQLDPMSPESLVQFDDRDEDGRLIGKTGIDRIKKLRQFLDGEVSKPLQIPGLVALTSKYGLEGAKLPESPLYADIRNQAFKHVVKIKKQDGSVKEQSLPLRVDLLNDFFEDPEVYRLVLAAEEFNVGLINLRQIDSGIEGGSRYRVNLQVFCRQAWMGVNPILKSKAWADMKRKQMIRMSESHSPL